MEKDTNLEELKRRYSEIREKHGLPSFQEMNEDFGVEKISEADFEILIREFRRYVADKIMNYLRFIETILNPSNASMFIFSIIKIINAEEKEKLTEIYKRLAELDLDIIELDVSFSEEKEAEFIKKSFNIWQEIKQYFLEIIGRIKKDWNRKEKKRNNSFIA